MDIVYDIETFPNCFTLAAEHSEYPLTWAFEISDKINDSQRIVDWLLWIKSCNGRMVGFNNVGFDYPVLHTIVQSGAATANSLYLKAQAIITSQDTDRFIHSVRPSDRIVPQIDLYKIHHFDNKARTTSLKAIEFNMRADNICDLPFPVGTALNAAQIEVLKRYNAHDVRMTKQFYRKSLDMIRFREELSQKYPRQDWINFNDTKIGKEFFAMELERAGVPCYDYSPTTGRTPKQTPRPIIHLKDAVLPWIRFDRPEFTGVLEWIRSQSITETKSVFNDVTATVNGFTYVFGLGGIHGSVEHETVSSNDDWVIVDLDVASFYPNLAISNKFYPEHLGPKFCVIYEALYNQRKQYPKKSAQSAMLKLALNGVYGDSNNPYSVFYDPLYTMKTTINGQMLLCMLAEKLICVNGVRLLQINTDGVTVMVPRENVQQVEVVRSEWESITKLQLEEVVYRQMTIRDVNNYVAVSESGNVKRKGAYEYDLDWHQNAGGLVIPKVAEKVLVDGAPIRETVENWPDIHDFMLRVKVPRGSKLVQVIDDRDVPLENTQRYYVSSQGHPLVKIMPPLAKNPGVYRRMNVESGWKVCTCNDIAQAVLPINFDYYIEEIEKLVLGVM